MHDDSGVWGSAIMGVMTAQQPLPMTMVDGVVPIGAAADLVEDSDGGEVYIHANLTYTWSSDDQALRRLTAVQLVEMQIAKVNDVAAAFGVDTATVCRRPRMSAITLGVSFDALLGPRLSGTRPRTPEPANSWRQRQTVAVSTPNAAATSLTLAICISTSWTAVRRRSAWSSLDQV